MNQSALIPMFLGMGIVLSAFSVIPIQWTQNAAAAEPNMMEAGRHLAKGQVSNVQFDDTGKPAWIESGIWVLKVNLSQDNEIQSSQLVARINMVKPDGTSMHSHSIFNFNASEMSSEGNSTMVLKGTATVRMRDGPVPDVPVIIKVFNRAVIGFWLGPEKLDGHFGTSPIYGTLAVKSMSPNLEEEPKPVESEKPDYSPSIDNPYFTLTPGMTYTYQGETDEGTEKNIVIVTNETKNILGVPAVVVWDRVWLDEELTEETYDWYAQDKEGNVWYFGEDSKEYNNDKVSTTEGSWEAGVDGAKQGIIMEAHPKVGDSYQQEYYKGQAEDMGEVLSLNEGVTVPYGTFTNCLKTKDWNNLEPGSFEFKYYCADVGGVVLETDEDGEERMELISFSK